MFGKEDFRGGATETLTEVLKYCTNRDKTYIIGGYSLAGLFALWVAYQTDVFKGVAAASPSVWFPGFVDFMRERDIHTGSVYLSLGNREEKARNPVMATMGNRIREVYDLLRKRGTNTTLEWNQGNHFKDVEIRMARDEQIDSREQLAHHHGHYNLWWDKANERSAGDSIQTLQGESGISFPVSISPEIM